MAAGAGPSPVIDVVDVSRVYAPTVALRGLTLRVPAGEIHALLGRNGAGKTTLVRILAGLVKASSGTCSLAGVDVSGAKRDVRRLVGLVPSGDRSFYLRLSALENMMFFGRLNGLGKRAARARSVELLAQVGLSEAKGKPMSVYSHGMQKRVSVARALLVDPPVLLVDEATHDLDPEGANQIRALVRHAADRGAAVLWATQRVEEIRGFADRVTVIDRGSCRFAGTVDELIQGAGARRFVVQLAPNGNGRHTDIDVLQGALGAVGRIVRGSADDGVFHLALSEGATLGSALRPLLNCGVELLGCRHELPEVEEAFLALVAEDVA